MKKNILSLVAFMAFSVSAFANTIEVKEEVVMEVKEEITQEFLESDTPCADKWLVNYLAFRDAGLGFNTSLALADHYFEECLDETYG
jgi:hypothetical protein